jgi:hypothetical protein
VLLFAATILTGALSRLRVRALGDEGRRPLAGDEIVPDAKGQWTNAITIRARPADIWPWIMQMGCARAGWYSYRRLSPGSARVLWPASTGSFSRSTSSSSCSGQTHPKRAGP